MARNTEKCEKCEIHTAAPGLWPENRKTRKMRHKHYFTLNMERNTENHGK